MCQEAVRKLCNPSESSHVRKVARLLARPLCRRPICFFSNARTNSRSEAKGDSATAAPPAAVEEQYVCFPPPESRCYPHAVVPCSPVAVEGNHRPLWIEVDRYSACIFVSER
jgi:hypothetical protein